MFNHLFPIASLVLKTPLIQEMKENLEWNNYEMGIP